VHGFQEVFEVLTIAKMGILNAPECDGNSGRRAASLRRHVAGFVQTTGAGVGRGEQARDADLTTQRFDTSALQRFNGPSVIAMQQERHSSNLPFAH
jgi:hypothetical protein